MMFLSLQFDMSEFYGSKLHARKYQQTALDSVSKMSTGLALDSYVKATVPPELVQTKNVHRLVCSQGLLVCHQSLVFHLSALPLVHTAPHCPYSSCKPQAVSHFPQEFCLSCSIPSSKL